VKCNAFGHVIKHCRGKETCSKCSGAHSYESCPNKESPKCINCKGPHSAAYRGCPKYNAATQVVGIQFASKECISYAAVVKKLKVSTVKAPLGPSRWFY